jgi:hypothetical protein
MKPHGLALVCWLGLQLAALALAALGVPLSDPFPRPPESLALHEMLAVQTIAAAMLAPRLLITWRGWVSSAAAALPFLVLAAILAARLDRTALWAGIYLTLWLATLWIWQQAARHENGRNWAAGAAVTLTVGGALLAYLRAEYATGLEWAQVGWHGPLAGALAVLEGGGWTAWLGLSIVALAVWPLAYLAGRAKTLQSN